MIPREHGIHDPSVAEIGREFFRRVGILLLVAVAFVVIGLLAWLVVLTPVGASIIALAAAVLSKALADWYSRSHFPVIRRDRWAPFRVEISQHEADHAYFEISHLHGELLALTSLDAGNPRRREVRLPLKELEHLRAEAFLTMSQTSAILAELENGRDDLLASSVTIVDQLSEATTTLTRLRDVIRDVPSVEQEKIVVEARRKLVAANRGLQFIFSFSPRLHRVQIFIVAACAGVAIALRVNEYPWHAYLVVVTFGLLANVLATAFSRAQLRFE